MAHTRTSPLPHGILPVHVYEAADIAGLLLAELYLIGLTASIQLHPEDYASFGVLFTIPRELTMLEMSHLFNALPFNDGEIEFRYANESGYVYDLCTKGMSTDN